jgi:hypothetical protein
VRAQVGGFLLGGNLDNALQGKGSMLFQTLYDESKEKWMAHRNLVSLS